MRCSCDKELELEAQYQTPSGIESLYYCRDCNKEIIVYGKKKITRYLPEAGNSIERVCSNPDCQRIYLACWLSPDINRLCPECENPNNKKPMQLLCGQVGREDLSEGISIYSGSRMLGIEDDD